MRDGFHRSPLGGPIHPQLRGILGFLVLLYVVQLLLEQWVGLPLSSWLALQPQSSGAWMPWQPLTGLLIQPSRMPLTAFLDWLMLYFFVQAGLQVTSMRALLRGCSFAFLFAALSAQLLDLVGALQGGVYMGLGPVLTALLVFFALSRPDAQILLFFVLPVQASWVAWGSGLLLVLYFLSLRELGSAVALGGWVGAWVWMQRHRWMPQRKKTRSMQDMERDLRRFQVIVGGKGRDDDVFH